MNHTFKNDDGHLVATASFDKDEIAKATDKAVIKLCQNVTVKGFRKGKAPIAEARKHIRSDDLANQVINDLLKIVDQEFFKDPEFNGYNLLGGFHPHVSLDKFSDQEALFTITYVLRPYVSELGNYKGITADAQEKEVTDADIDDRIKHLAEQNGELVDKEEPIEEGDTVNIDFTGLLNGEAFDGGSAKSYDLMIGSNKFVPGFEEQLIGHKAGEKIDVNVTLPEEYPEPLTGKAVLFKVVINSVMRKEIPNIDDDFATTLSGQYVAKDLADLREKVRGVLIEQNHQDYQRQIINSLLLQVRDSSSYVIPDEYVEQLTQDQIKMNSDRIGQQGLTFDQYLRLIKKDKDTYTSELREQITQQLKTSLVYDAIFSAEKLAYPTNQEIEAKLGRPVNTYVQQLTNYYRSMKLSDDEIRNEINDTLNQVNSSIIFEKVQNRLLELNGYEVPKEEKTDEKSSTDEEKDSTDTESETDGEQEVSAESAVKEETSEESASE